MSHARTRKQRLCCDSNTTRRKPYGPENLRKSSDREIEIESENFRAYWSDTRLHLPTISPSSKIRSTTHQPPDTPTTLPTNSLPRLARSLVSLPGAHYSARPALPPPRRHHVNAFTRAHAASSYARHARTARHHVAVASLGAVVSAPRSARC